MVWLRRNKVALTIVMGLALIGLFAVIESGFVAFAITRFRISLNQIANTELPALIAASKLSELSQTFAATAPEIALAESQTARQALADQLRDRLATLARAVDEVGQSAVGHNQMTDMRRQLDGLVSNLRGLDGLVRARIDGNNEFESIFARLPTLAARVRAVADEVPEPTRAQAPQPDSGMSSLDRTNLVQWSATGLESITLMLATPTVHFSSRIDRLKAQLSTLEANMEAIRKKLPRAILPRVQSLHRDIFEFGLGPSNIFDARRVQIETATAIQTSLRLNQQVSVKFIAAVSEIVNATQHDISDRAGLFNKTASYFNFIIVGISLLCIAVGVTIFLYVRHSVIIRLQRLQEYMRGQVEGQPGAISIDGEDEIAEMAKATQFFVTGIARREAVLQTTFDSMAQGVVMFDDDFKMAAWNRQFQKLLDVPDALLSRHVTHSELIRHFDENNDDGRADIEARPDRHNDPPWEPKEDERTRRDGTVLEITRNAVSSGGFVVMFSDITPRKRAQEVADRAMAELVEAHKDLEQARDVALKASQHKSQFLANMSHELRTPLNAIIGVTEMLQEDARDLKRDDEIEPLDRVLKAARHLLALINDILDLSKVEAGRMELYPETFALTPLINEVAATIAPLAAINDNRLVVECNPNVGTIHADQMRLRQALLNLASNANKFTELGTVTIAADRRQEEGGEWISISVSDTGIGMTSEQIGKLFQDFSQADASTTRKYGGTGLGLAISRRFCQLMGGDITVKSERARGSTFTIRLPSRYLTAKREGDGLD